MRRQEKMFDRYEGSRGSQFLDYISKDIKSRNSKNSNSRNFSSNKQSNHTNADIFSQAQIIRPRKGASVLRNSSTSKYAESMGKFRKQFIKDSYVNYDYQQPTQRKITTKEENSVSFATVMNFDEEIGVQDMHYQMVRLHQNVKKIQKDT